MKTSVIALFSLFILVGGTHQTYSMEDTIVIIKEEEEEEERIEPLPLQQENPDLLENIDQNPVKDCWKGTKYIVASLGISMFIACAGAITIKTLMRLSISLALAPDIT